MTASMRPPRKDIIGPPQEATAKVVAIAMTSEPRKESKDRTFVIMTLKERSVATYGRYIYWRMIQNQPKYCSSLVLYSDVQIQGGKKNYVGMSLTSSLSNSKAIDASKPPVPAEVSCVATS